MVPGISGELVSGAFLDRVVTEPIPDPSPFQAWVRELARWERRARQSLGPASGTRAMLDVGARPLIEGLGFRIERLEGHAWGHAGLLSSGTSPSAALLSLTWGRPSESAWREATRVGLAASLPWALLVNGRTLTIQDCARPWSRRSLTIDLAIAAAHPAAARVLWRCARADAIGGSTAAGTSDLVRASDAHGAEVCHRLGAGVLEALQTLVAAFDDLGRTRARGRHRHEPAVFEQALTVVYRVLFLLFAEARSLVPVWHALYRDAYSMDALCRRLMHGPGARGAWATLRAISRLSHAGCRALDLDVTAFNGRLFSPTRTPLAEHGRIPDEGARRVLLALATTSTRNGRHRIAFNDLGVEQLGSVYERLLEYEPARVNRHLTLQPTSSERKTTGSFYTPRAMTEFLVRRTLAPLVRGRSAEEIFSLRVLDPAMGSGAFLVAACRYLASCVEQARVEEGQWTDGEVTDTDRAVLRRTVAERCLYGVDINPTAVQLTRLSLWLTTLAADRPLSFLDHHLAVGNSLLGARVRDLGSLPGRRADRRSSQQLTLFDDDAAVRLARWVLPDRARLALDPSNDVADVRAKERRLDRLMADDAPLSRWSRAADLWCGLLLESARGPSPGLYAELQRHLAGLPTSLHGRELRTMADRALAAARSHLAFHWELAFPEVFLGDDAPESVGFDAIVGNPPWEMLRADTGRDEDRQAARERAQAVGRFVRGAGHYGLHAGGHVNQYQLFVERALGLLRAGGRVGLILPSGLQCDVGSAGLRRELLDHADIDTWLGFDNRRGIFPIHRGIRFVLFTATSGPSSASVPVVSGLSDPDVLQRLADDAAVDGSAGAALRLSRSLIARSDPVHLTIPFVERATDLAVLVRALEAPSLTSADGWGVSFGRELNATDDKRHFGPAAPANSDALPVIEGKHLRPFGVALDTVTIAIDRATAARLIDPAASFARPRIGCREVASATNRLTLIAARLPAGVITTHTVHCSRPALSEDDEWCLVALLNSLVANYLVRLQMSTHVTSALMARLPVPRPRAGSPVHAQLVGMARTLASAAADQDPATYAQLNALTASLYRLSAVEYRRVVETFPLLTAEVREACQRAFMRDATEPQRHSDIP